MIHPRFKPGVARELLRFSAPLLGVGLTANVMGWSGTLVLGMFSNPHELGLFNAPFRLVNLIPIPLTAMIYMYLPVATATIARSDAGELRELYTSTTKWAFFATLPLLFYCVMDADYLVVALFGQEYSGSAGLLRLLAIGYSVHTFLGPNGMTLIALDDSRTVFLGTMLAAASTLALCLLLVPRAGALGAAAATAAAQLISNGYISLSLWRRFEIHPFRRGYVLPVLASAAIAGFLWMGMGTNTVHAWYEHAALFCLLVAIVAFTPLALGSMSQADVELLSAVERRLWKRQILSRFLARKTNT